MSSSARPADTFAVLVDEPPFGCNMIYLEEGLKRMVRAMRLWLNQQINYLDEAKGSTYACLIYDPTDLLGGPIVAINLGGSDPSRFINAAAKVDWMRTHPDLDFEVAVERYPWLIGQGQFLWGHATKHLGFPAAGSGLSARGDCAILEVGITELASVLRSPMSGYIKQSRAAGVKWLEDKPRAEYHGVLGDIEGWPAIAVS